MLCNDRCNQERLKFTLVTANVEDYSHRMHADDVFSACGDMWLHRDVVTGSTLARLRASNPRVDSPWGSSAALAAGTSAWWAVACLALLARPCASRTRHPAAPSTAYDADPSPAFLPGRKVYGMTLNKQEHTELHEKYSGGIVSQSCVVEHIA